jgi:chitinase
VDFLTIDGYDYAGTWDKQTNEAIVRCTKRQQNPCARPEARSIDETVTAYLKAGVPAGKYTMGLPLYAVGWTGVRQCESWFVPELSICFAGSAWPMAQACVQSRDKTAPSPGCDSLMTRGIPDLRDD